MTWQFLYSVARFLSSLTGTFLGRQNRRGWGWASVDLSIGIPSDVDPKALPTISVYPALLQWSEPLGWNLGQAISLPIEWLTRASLWSVQWTGMTVELRGKHQMSSQPWFCRSGPTPCLGTLPSGQTGGRDSWPRDLRGFSLYLDSAPICMK